MLVASSGGGDSVALLHALTCLGQRVASCHVHHGTRGAEADADLRFARQRATALGVPFFSARVDAARRDGDSPEARARRLRYAALERIRSAHGYDWVGTAHTQDDQAETLLLRAVRGSDVAGLAGIASLDVGRRLLRPLLEVRRQDLRDYLRARGIPWREDSTNADRRVPRNRLRADVLPILEELAPGASGRLARLAVAARETEQLVADEVSRWFSAHARVGDAGLWLDRAALVALPGALRRRALVRALGLLGLGDRLSRAQLERLEAFVAEGQSGRRWSLGSATLLVLDRQAVWFGPEPGPRYPSAFAVELCPPDPLERPERDLRLSWRRVDRLPDVARAARVQHPIAVAQAGRSTGAASRSLWLPSRPGRLVVRSPRRGDRLRVSGPGESGARRSRLLADMFADADWSRSRRSRAVVVELEREPVWVVGLAGGVATSVSCDSGWELRAEPFRASSQLLESGGTAHP